MSSEEDKVTVSIPVEVGVQRLSIVIELDDGSLVRINTEHDPKFGLIDRPVIEGMAVKVGVELDGDCSEVQWAAEGLLKQALWRLWGWGDWCECAEPPAVASVTVNE